MSQDKSNIVKGLAASFGHPIRSPILRRPEEYGLEYEDVFFPSMDGTPLEGWFFPAASNKLIIANHPLWFNRYGFPAHLDPWKQIGAAGGNDFEVNFMPDYKHLHDAGYNVLAYDLRNFGLSGAANGGITGNGLFEYRDVIGSLQYVKNRKDLSHMTVGLFSRCAGANSTMIAMTKHPQFFKDVRCMVAPQPISLRPWYEKITEILGIPDKINEIENEIRLISGLKLDDMSPIEYAKNVHVPTFIIQVHDDVLTKPNDVQQIFDNIPTKDKKLFWIEGTTRRWDGYNYFPEHPEQMIEWFDKHMC
jgi:esterase/lipase